jgi:DNA-binding transcriptional LysR family regulator
MVDPEGAGVMDTNQIIYFLALCDELHFTRAARRCGIAQPSMTNAIRALENELGGRLFHRKPKPRLSELGQWVQPHLRLALTHIGLALAHGVQAPARPRGRARNARRRPLQHLAEEHGRGSQSFA